MFSYQLHYFQDYLREQHDNIRSTDLISETVNFLSHTYLNITKDSIKTIIQIFDSLIEFVSVSKWADLL